MKKLYRSETNKKVEGVCGGIAEYFDIDPTLIRLGWVILTCCSGGAGLVGYIICCAVIPKKSEVTPD